MNFTEKQPHPVLDDLINGNKEEIKALSDVIESGWWGKGAKVAEFESEFAKMVGHKYAIAVTSASHGQDLVMKALNLKNIDVINHTENIQLLITRALSPAKVISINLNEDSKRAQVFMDADQVSLAIGKGGFNISLAGKLSEYEIDVYRDEVENEDDVAIDEFKDEIESWIIDELKSIGCDTARSVLSIESKDLVSRTDLESETVEEVIKILKAEFEE